jgi:hypothetical protein
MTALAKMYLRYDRFSRRFSFGIGGWGQSLERSAIFFPSRRAKNNEYFENLFASARRGNSYLPDAVIVI